MKAHHGYEDGSGRYDITVDTDLCNGCEECVKVAACEPDAIEHSW